MQTYLCYVLDKHSDQGNDEAWICVVGWIQVLFDPLVELVWIGISLES